MGRFLFTPRLNFADWLALLLAQALFPVIGWYMLAVVLLWAPFSVAGESRFVR
jgi:hypothetical protein